MHFIAGAASLACLAGPGCSAHGSPGASSSQAVSPRGLGATQAISARVGAMVRIPGGTFLMGSNDGDADERPVHAVNVAAFALDQTEVTVQAYEECVSAGACHEPSRYEPTQGNWQIFCNWRHPDGRARHPINCVDWNQATTFCGWAGKRLPTEEEWEYAARRGNRKYPWGDDPPNERLVNACGSECVADGVARGFPSRASIPWGSDAWPETAPVGSFPAGASIDGVQDLIGNVWEWTSSGYSSDYGKERTNDARVFRGGYWSGSATYLRASSRVRLEPTYRSGSLGFRCAL